MKMKNIKNRTSARTYNKVEISTEVLEKLKKFIDEIEEYSDYRFPIINSKVDGKVGTYGVITGANYYICAIVKKDKYDLVQLGYLFEKIILFATSLNLGTCWLGGTFDRGDFSKKVNLMLDEQFIAATPIGFKAQKKSVRDRAMRRLAKSDRRKDFGELFFDEKLNALNQDTLGVYGTALKMVRIAPSASNKQPWRIIKQKNVFHLYLKRTPGYGKGLGYDIQLLDIGIAKYHFETSLREFGEAGDWKVFKKHPLYEDLEYISTWMR